MKWYWLNVEWMPFRFIWIPPCSILRKRAIRYEKIVKGLPKIPRWRPSDV